MALDSDRSELGPGARASAGNSQHDLGEAPSRQSPTPSRDWFLICNKRVLDPTFGNPGWRNMRVPVGWRGDLSS